MIRQKSLTSINDSHFQNSFRANFLSYIGRTSASEILKIILNTYDCMYINFAVQLGKLF